jgi:hypothetical protein
VPFSVITWPTLASACAGGLFAPVFVSLPLLTLGFSLEVVWEQLSAPIETPANATKHNAKKRLLFSTLNTCHPLGVRARPGKFW